VTSSIPGKDVATLRGVLNALLLDCDQESARRIQGLLTRCAEEFYEIHAGTERAAKERRAVDASIRAAVTRAITEREVMEQNAGMTTNPDVERELREEYIPQLKLHAERITRIIADKAAEAKS
jgi:hypothetical protein